jgi:uncharacterized protein YjbI with pentapeptide repeats
MLPNLSGANMDRASFRQANLIGADLSETHMTRCRFNDANLSGANLTGAYASETHFTSVNFTGANLSNAGWFDIKIDNAIFQETIIPDLIFDEEE